MTDGVALDQLDSRSDRQRFLIFILTGGFAAAVNVGARIALSHVMPYEAAVAVAYLAGMTTAFLLARRFVFGSASRSIAAEFVRFGLVNVVAFIQVWLVSVGLAAYVFPMIGFTWFPDLVAHLIGVASPIVTSYYAHKHFSFARHDDAKR